MTALIRRRILQAIPLLLVISSLTFVLVSLIPGSVAAALYGLSATPEQQAEITRKLGLAKPLYTQYWNWLTHALQANLGSSLLNQQSVVALLNQRIGVTLTLTVMTVIVVAIVGIGLGVYTSLRPGLAARFVDRLSWLGHSIPNFWLGLALVTVFSLTLRWLPSGGYVPFATSPVRWLESLILPVVSLAIAPLAVVIRQTRAALVRELSSDYVRTLRAAGVSEASLIFRHALKNAAVPVVTVLGLDFVGLLGGTVVVETVFVLPGIGGLAASSVPTHDLPVIEGVVVYYTLIVIAVNLVLDILYGWLDPKVRIS
jgi:peptide/nickel transport system permease protein